MKRLAIFLILFLFAVQLFSATGITLMGAFDMSSADLWVGAGSGR